MLLRRWCDAVNCARGLKAVHHYRTDGNQRRRTFSDKPLHDWWSHAANAFRYLAAGLPREYRPFPPLRYDKLRHCLGRGSRARPFRQHYDKEIVMHDPFKRAPRFGSTDWGAQQFLRMLDREERRKAELERLRATGWQPAAATPSQSASDGPTFNDGRDALVDFVQNDLDRRSSFVNEARRRAQKPLAQTSSQSAADGRKQEPQSPAAPSDEVPGQVPVQVIPKRPLPMPERMGLPYRKGWNIFGDTLRDPTHMQPLTESEFAAYRTTFGLEGGMQYDAAAGGPGDPGRAGVTESWMKDAQPRLGSTIVPDARKLTIQQAAQAYKIFADDALRNVGGGGALAKIGDSKTAMQVFDALFKHGREGGAIVIQDAVNALIGGLPRDERARLGLSPIVIQDPRSRRAFGPQTLDRVAQLVDAGYAQALRNAIADQRAIYEPVPEKLSGLKYRYDYHR